MLIHGRLLLTHNNLMLDEVRSLLQKSLRRQSPLAFQATKELIGFEKDQLPWKSIVTFIFEDHCLNNLDFFKTLYSLYEKADKYKSVELIHRAYTCRHAACLQVVALSDDFCSLKDIFKSDLETDSSLKGLVVDTPGKEINIDLLLTNIMKNWQDGNVRALARLFSFVNMAAKIEKRKLTQKGMNYLIVSRRKAPTLYQLVMSVLYKHTTDGYMKELIEICYKFAMVPDVPKGLILFSILTNLEYKETAINAYVDCSNFGLIDWKGVQKLDNMPTWAVDKHTFRGKFGKGSKHVFMKKFKNVSPLTEAELEEFHGIRPKSDIKMFFDEGCICTNDILSHNPIWEDTKNMYFKQKPSQRKTAKMTQAVYQSIRKSKVLIFGKICVKKDGPDVHMKKETEEENKPGSSQMRENIQLNHYEKSKKRKHSADNGSNGSAIKRQKLEMKSTTVGDEQSASTKPSGPLLQLPTGSAKVYTRLDNVTGKVWKGPYKNREKLNLCMFFHKAMKDVFKDKHTLEFEQWKNYLLFPLVKLNKDEIPAIVSRSYYDCIAKKEVSADEGAFVDRSSLGIIQLHKLEPDSLSQLPVSIWAHFAFRYFLNIGDSGLYNAIATTDLRELYGIDMEENRANVRGSGLLDLIFVKQPSKRLRGVIENKILNSVEEFSDLVFADFDFFRLEGIYRAFGMKNKSDRCKARLAELRTVVDKMCVKEIGV